MQDVVLHLGDCLEFMRTLEDGAVDCVVTDPPYGTGAWLRSGSGNGSDPTAKLVVEDWDVWNTEWLKEARRIARTVVCFVPSLRMSDIWEDGCRMLVWIKPDPRPRFQMQPAYGFEPIIAFGPLQPIGGTDYISQSTPRLNRDADGTEHPHQKPIQVVDWLVALSSPLGSTVLDPFMGSGTTGVACVRTGRRFIGAEIDPTYFAIAQRRIAEAQLQPPLFPHEPQPQAQQLPIDTAHQSW